MSKQQRRKGNAKNASSAAAHEYLANGGAAIVGLTSEMNIFELASSNKIHQVAGIDDETRIVIKKLTKKDQLTREKGLKELMAMINSETASIENCYEHFCGLVAQLSTDGSPSVRLLTMKTITLFLTKMKKAASRGLKKIIPMVLFAKSDVTNGVAAAAAGVIRDGFDADKKQQIIQVFGPSAFEMAASIAQGTHELSLPLEYDGSETRETRQSRLETQALNVFLLYLKEFGGIGADSDGVSSWEEFARKLFENSGFVKKCFAGNKETLKVQLLTLAYRFSDPVELLLSLPPIVPYIQNTLDVQTFTPECATAWEGLTMLIRDERFQSKVSLAKAIYPRFLNVIRKKGNHWRILKNHLLIAVTALLEQLKNPEGDLKMLTAIMESFADNLPWHVEASMNAIHCWFSTYADFVRWILTNDRVNLEILETLIPLTCRISEQAMLFNTSEATDSISALVSWIIEKKMLSEVESARFCDLLQEQITKIDQERSKSMRNALTAPGRLMELSGLHAALLSDPELADFHVLKNLANSEAEYFDAVLNKISDFSFVEQTEKFDAVQSEVVVHLIQRILERRAESQQPNQKNLKIQVKNDNVGRQLLLSASQKIWDQLLKNAPNSVFQEMINFWHEERNGKAIAEAVVFLQKMGITLDTEEVAENVDFLISLLNSLDSTASDSDSEKKMSVIRKLFTALFETEEEPKVEHFKNVADHLTPEFDSNHFFDSLFTNHEAFDTERIVEISARFDKLIGLCPFEKQIAESMMVSREEYEQIAEKLRFLEIDVLAYSPVISLITDSFGQKSEYVDEQEAIHRVKISGRKALFNLASKYSTTIHHVFGFQMVEVIRRFTERYTLKAIDEELKFVKEEITVRVKKSDEVAPMIIGSRAPNFVAEVFEETREESRQGNPTASDSEDVEQEKRKIMFAPCDSPIEYLEKVHEAVQSDGYFELFQFDQSIQNNWLANITFAKKFLECGSMIFTTENFELRDFSLCGIVTVLDHAADTVNDYSHAFENNPRLEALTTIYMEVFLALNAAAKSGELPEQRVEEWNEFFAPTIRSYVIRLFRSVRKDQQPTPFIRTLLKVLFTFSEFPADVPADDVREFVPELSVFNYPAFQESCISQSFALLSSDVEHIQLIGYAMAKLLMPLMFRRENEKALKVQDESEVTVSNRPKVDLPVMIVKSYPKNDHLNPHVATLLVDLALLPLQNPVADATSFTQEQRVSYCDSIDGFIKFGLNQLLLDQPFEFRQCPIGCRIPRSQDREYYLETDLTASPIFFDKFAARLLFKTITLLPAAVRLFYKGMKNVYMPMFQEAVTKYASKLLIEQELAKVRQTDFGADMKVRTVPVTGEIIAEYIVEETKMKLTIGLPPDYPLSVPTMTLDKAIVKTDRAKKWLLQLNAYLFHQNGAILEGIEMWKRNVDKGVEGVEDCTICMMTVHQQTHQLPRIRCKQCKNKFHSNCLYKWFETSNQSTCPLCRTNFT